MLSFFNFTPVKHLSSRMWWYCTLFC